MANYGNESIVKLTDGEAVRMRTATYAGSSDVHGAFTTVREIISNAIDEYKAGHGDEITVIYDKDNRITVKDNGRGVPMDWNENAQQYNYDLIYCQLNAGGKYDKSEDNVGYDYAIGLNGIGSALTILSSDKASVKSVRDGKVYTMNFDEGNPVGELQIQEDAKTWTGTEVTWIPSLDVFDDNEFKKEWFEEYISQQAIVNKGLRINLQYHDDEMVSYYYEEGIQDYLKALNEKGFTTPQYVLTDDFYGQDREDRPAYRSKYEFVYAFNNENPRIESYHNSSFLRDGGSPHDAIKSAFVYEIDKQINLLGLYNKSESKIKFDDIVDSLLIITNTYSTESSYQGQTKFALTNKFVKDKLNELLRSSLHVYFVENAKEAQKICMQVLANKRSRERAEKTRLDVRKKLSGDINSMDSGKRVEGLINCESKDKSKNVLAICEGKSALSSIRTGRTKYHAIYPIRGKVLNCFKASMDKILENDVIVGIYKALGCGLEIGKKGSKTYTFDIEKMNFHSVEIYVDADEDGIGSIFPLLLVMFWKLTPTLMREGRIKLGVTPKYEVQTLNEQYYAMNDKELEALQASDVLKGQKYEIHYIKGLAELTVEGMTMAMSRENNQTIEVRVDEESESIEVLELFMSDDVKTRKEFILSTFEEVEVS